MIDITAFAYTGYPATDITCARAFYEDLLGFKPSLMVENEGKFWIEYDRNGATLALSNMWSSWKPSADGPMLAFEVTDFDATVAALLASKVRFTLEPMDSGMCRLAIVLDPSGNCVGVHQRRSN